MNKTLLILLLMVRIPLSSTFCEEQSSPLWAGSEVVRYRTQISRRDEVIKGETVLTYLARDFSTFSQVEGGSEIPPQERVRVVRLNLLRNLKGEDSDRSIMLTVFAPLTPWSSAGVKFPQITPIKAAFSSQTLGGIHYQQINATSKGYRWLEHSYLPGSGDSFRDIPLREYSVFEDDLLIRTRELISPFPSGVYSMLTSLLYPLPALARVDWVKAEVEKQLKPEKLESFLGHIDAALFTVKSPGREWQVWVERGLPRRVLRWQVRLSFADGEYLESSEITEAERVPPS